jgi:hypothetical protein
MSTAIATFTTTTGFLDKAGRGVMAWLRGLLNATPAALAASHGSTSRDIASYYKVGYRMALLRRADEIETTSPQEAAELRAQAAAV